MALRQCLLGPTVCSRTDMKVLVIAPYVPLERMSHAGGVATYHLIRGLAETCQVECLCWGADEDLRALRADSIRAQIQRVLPRGLGPLRSFVTALRCLFREPMATTVLLAEMVLARLRGDPFYGHLSVLMALTVVEANKLIASQGYDVVHVEHSALATIGRFLRHPVKVLLFYDVFQMLVCRMPITSRARESASRLERRGSAYYAGFITVSRKDTEFVARTSRKPVFQLAVFVDAPAHIPTRVVVPGSILFLGALDRDVNAQAARFLVRDVMPLVRQSVPMARLTIVGANPPRDLVEAAAANPDHVQVTGFVNDVSRYFLVSHVFAGPLFVGGGVIVKILTAMAFGVPVVATGIAVEGIDALEDVHYLRAEGPAEFATQLTRVLCDDVVAGALAASARCLYDERADWLGSVRQLVRFYASLLPSGAPPGGAR